MYIEHVLNEMKRLGIPNPRKFVPCTEEEVAHLEEATHLSLPQTYREFLRTMGKDADLFLMGSDFMYPQLLNLQEVAREILIEDAFPQSLPEDAFVFFMHQGYQFGFFRTSEGDDPPVYWYVEQKEHEAFRCPYPQFTEFLLDMLRIEADIFRQLRKPS